MSERWRKKLGDLDKVGPDDEVFDRAQIGPQHPEDPIERPSTGARIVTAVAAFTVFALAIAVFAIPALRLKEGAGQGFGNATMLPLWPAQTLEEAEAVQADADSGGDATRYTDPEHVAEIFGHNVLGWSDLTIDDGNTQQGFIADDYPPCRDNFPSGGNSICYGLNPTQSGTPTTGYTYDGPTAAPSTVGSSLFRTMVVRCNGDVCAGYSSTITLFQPVRREAGGVWMVLHVEGSAARPVVGVGDVVSVGDKLGSAGIMFSDITGILGVRVGAPGSDCTALTTVNEADGRTLPNASAYAAAAVVRIPRPFTPDGQPCEGPFSAYAFVATVSGDTSDTVSFDPFDPFAGATGVVIDSLNAVPFIVLDNQVQPTITPTSDLSEGPPTIGPSLSPAPIGGLEKYQAQGLGSYSLAVPTGWTALDFSSFDTRVTYTGTIVSNVAFPAAIPDDPRSVSLGDAEVRVTLAHRDGGPAPDLTSDDHGFDPLLAQAIKPGDRFDLPFRMNGIDWVATVEAGPDTPQQALDAMFAVVASLTFPELTPGERVDGWTALYPANKPVDWQNIATNVIVVMTTGQGRVALDTVDTCGEGQNMTSDAAGNAIIECPDGSVIGYTADGHPLPGNPAGYRDSLDVHPVITAWNGRLLTQLGGMVAVAV